MRRQALISTLALLAGCSERVIVAANEQVLVVAERIDHKASAPTAEVHYRLANPSPLSDAPADAGALVSGMRHEATFDCAKGAWGSRVHDVILTDGRVISDSTPTPTLETPSNGSIGEDVLKSVCDPAFRAAHATRRPRASIEKDYLARH